MRDVMRRLEVHGERGLAVPLARLDHERVPLPDPLDRPPSPSVPPSTPPRSARPGWSASRSAAAHCCVPGRSGRSPECSIPSCAVETRRPTLAPRPATGSRVSSATVAAIQPIQHLQRQPAPESASPRWRGRRPAPTGGPRGGAPGAGGAANQVVPGDRPTRPCSTVIIARGARGRGRSDRAAKRPGLVGHEFAASAASMQ